MKRYAFRSKAKALTAAVIDAAGSALVRPFSRESGVSPDQTRTFLLLRLDHIGDVVAASGLPKLLKENFPRSQVLFAVSSQAAPVLENNPFVDEVLIYDAPWFASGRFTPKPGGHTFSSLAASLRARKIDVGLSLRGDLRENYLLWKAGVKSRVGYGVTGGGFFLTREVRYRFDSHESERSLDLARSLGVHVKSAPPAIYFSDEERRSFGTRLEEWGLKGRFALFQAAAGSGAKDWPTDSARRFIEEFLARFPDVRLVLTGNDSKDIVLSQAVLDLRKRATLRELALLAEKAQVFVGPDSGPGHLASAVGTPVVFLYSGTNEWRRWRPLADNAVAIRNEVVCSPCALRECPVAGHPCMSGITPTEVIEAAARFLERP